MAQYIDKSAVVAEIERRLWLLVPKMTFQQQRVELEKLLSFLNSLEVKEVDLEKEIDSTYRNYVAFGRKEIATVAKHFFELGLKAKE